MARTLLFVLALLLIGGFVALNWPAFTVPATLTLGVVDLHAPLGLIMLGIVGIVALAFILWALTIQGGALMEARRMARELHAKSELADKAEASRFTELRSHIDARIDQLQRSVEQQANGLAAQLGQLEDRLAGQPRPASAVVVDTGLLPRR